MKTIAGNSERRVLLVCFLHRKPKARAQMIKEAQLQYFGGQDCREIRRRMDVLLGAGKLLGDLVTFADDPTLSDVAKETLFCGARETAELRRLSRATCEEMLARLRSFAEARLLLQGMQTITDAMSGDDSDATVLQGKAVLRQTVRDLDRLDGEGIYITEDLRSLSLQCCAAIAAKQPKVFSFQHTLVSVLDSTAQLEPTLEPGTTVMRRIPAALLQETLSASANFFKTGKKETKEVQPPKDLAERMYHRGEWPGIREIVGVVEFPQILADGTIISKRGYDARTKTYSSCDLDFSRVPEKPSLRDARKALGRLYGLLGDFPWGDRAESGKAAWVALCLTLLARSAIKGPVPLWILQATTRGSGKSLLGTMAHELVSGAGLPMQTYPQSSEPELEKILVGIAVQGLAATCFDNVTSKIGNGTLNKWLTSTKVSARILGANDQRNFDWRTVLIATSNQAVVDEDTDRRAVYCSFTPSMEYPESRDVNDFRYPDIIGHIRERRTYYLECCLVLLRGYAAAGRPKQQGRPKGSFESWCSVVRDAILWAGGEDAELASADSSRPGDDKREQNKRIVEALQRLYRDGRFTVQQLLVRLERQQGVPGTEGNLWREFSDLSTKGKPSATSVGKVLSGLRDRWLGEVRIRRSNTLRNGVRQWWIEKSKPDPDEADPFRDEDFDF